MTVDLLSVSCVNDVVSCGARSNLIAATRPSVPGLDAQHTSLSVLLTGCVCLQGSDHTVELIAAILLPVAIVMCAYALTVFIWRAKAITRKQVGSLISNHSVLFIVQWLYPAWVAVLGPAQGQLRRIHLTLQFGRHCCCPCVHLDTMSQILSSDFALSWFKQVHAFKFAASTLPQGCARHSLVHTDVEHDCHVQYIRHPRAIWPLILSI